MESQKRNITLFSNEKDFQSFFRLFHPGFRSFGVKLTNDVLIAEDAVQEAFIKLWERKENFQHETAAKSFMYTSIRNYCLNHIEHLQVADKYKQFISNKAADFEEFDHNILLEETHSMIYRAICELPPRCKEIVLFSMNGLKNYEIAQELKISENTVKAQKKIAYKQLKIKLKNIYPLAGIFLSSFL